MVSAKALVSWLNATCLAEITVSVPVSASNQDTPGQRVLSGVRSIFLTDSFCLGFSFDAVVKSIDDVDFSL